jgi:type II secretory pathway pseudopilin PulG
MAELIVSTALLGMAIAGIAVVIQGATTINRYQWTRQRCVAAAEAQIDSLVATGKPIDEIEIARLWPETQVTVDRTPGQAAWERLDLIRVTAVGMAGPHPVTVHLERYVRKDHR